jgi:hypothetical protein
MPTPLVPAEIQYRKRNEETRKPERNHPIWPVPYILIPEFMDITPKQISIVASNGTPDATWRLVLEHS